MHGFIIIIYARVKKWKLEVGGDRRKCCFFPQMKTFFLDRSFTNYIIWPRKEHYVCDWNLPANRVKAWDFLPHFLLRSYRSSYQHWVHWTKETRKLGIIIIIIFKFLYGAFLKFNAPGEKLNILFPCCFSCLPMVICCCFSAQIFFRLPY